MYRHLPAVKTTDFGLAPARAALRRGAIASDAAGHLGTTVGMLDATGALIGTARYWPYGALGPTTGTPASTFTYDGEQVDASGLVYLRARYADPATGRFVSQDPFANFGGGTQTRDRYAYVLDDPSQLSDPYGLFPCPGCGKIKRGLTKIAHGVETAFTSANCYSAVLSTIGVVTIFVAPEFAPAIAAGLFLFAEGPQFAFGTINNARQIDSKEGWSFNNITDVAGSTANLAAYNSAAVRLGLESGSAASKVAGYAAIPAAVIGGIQCGFDIANG